MWKDTVKRGATMNEQARRDAVADAETLPDDIVVPALSEEE